MPWGILKHRIVASSDALYAMSLYDEPEMQDPDPSRRVAYISSLFLVIDEAERMMADAKTVCRQAKIDNISFYRNLGNYSMRDVEDAVFEVLSRDEVSSGYIGVTTDVAWRWEWCDCYNEMVAHKRRFDYMVVILCEKCEPALFLEEEMIDFARASGYTLDNALVYRSGPIRPRNKLFLYVCIKTACKKQRVD